MKKVFTLFSVANIRQIACNNKQSVDIMAVGKFVKFRSCPQLNDCVSVSEFNPKTVCSFISSPWAPIFVEILTHLPSLAL